MKVDDIDQLAINTLRTLAIDAVEAASSGHPRTPMALAPFAYTLWNSVLHFDPQDLTWPQRPLRRSPDAAPRTAEVPKPPRPRGDVPAYGFHCWDPSGGLVAAYVFERHRGFTK